MGPVMSRSFLARLPLARFEVDRDYRMRERPEIFRELWADPATRILPVWNSLALLSAPDALALVPVTAIGDADLLVYLGRTTEASATEPTGTPVVAALLDDPGLLAGRAWGNLRDVGVRLSDRDAGLFTEAVAMINWHDSHRFSPRTGDPTLPAKGGWVRIDPANGAEVFPRTDAAVIVGVTDAADRMLLGSNALWEPNRYSLLAGFVEPGESLESAVIREVFEESGVSVVDPVYLGSQPWPFPASLMVGFSAVVDPSYSGSLVPDGEEILDVRWFSRDDIRRERNTLLLPRPSSIARAIIEDWFGEPIVELDR